MRPRPPLARHRAALAVLAAVAALGAAACGGDDADDAATAPAAGVCDPADGALETAFVFVTAPTAGQRVEGGFELAGCSRTFESNVPWRLLDREGRELASGATTGGGADGPAQFRATVEFSIRERQIGHLEVIEEDASDGEGFPPARNVIPLVLVP